MSILLSILRIVGIVLLVVLIVVLSLILFVLLSSIRYESTGQAGPGKILIRARVTWLLKILGINVLVDEDKVKIDVRILFLHPLRKVIPWKYPFADKAENDVSKEHAKPQEPVKTKNVDVAAGSEHGTSVETDIVSKSTQDEKKSSKQEKKSSKKERKKVESVGESTPESQREESSLVENKHNSVSGTVTGQSEDSIIEDEPEEPAWKTKLNQGKAILEDPSTWKTVNLVKRTIFKILKHILPTNGRLHGIFGTGDPGLDGRILGVFYAGYALYGDKGDYRLAADFDNKILKGKYYIKGKILPGYIVIRGLRLLLDKNIRRLIFHKK